MLRYISIVLIVTTIVVSGIAIVESSELTDKEMESMGITTVDLDNLQEIFSSPSGPIYSLQIGNISEDIYLFKIVFEEDYSSSGTIRIYLDRDNDPSTGRKDYEGMDYLMVAGEVVEGVYRKPYGHEYFWTADGTLKSENKPALGVIKEKIIYLVCKVGFTKTGKIASGRICVATETSETAVPPFSFSIKLKEKKIVEEERITLSNHSIDIFFENADNGFALADIIKKDSGLSLLYKGYKDRDSLWNIILQSNKGPNREGVRSVLELLSSDTVSINNNTKAKKSYKIENTGEGKALFFNWSDIDIGDEPGVLDVTARIDIKNGDDFSYWNISINNRSKIYGIWEVYYPIINMAPIKDDPANNYFVIPYGHSGEVIRDPFYSTDKSKIDVAVQGGRTDGSMKMSFVAYYHSSGDGIYFGMYDSQSYMKRVSQSVYSPENRNKLTFVHFPDNIGYPQENYSMSYPIAIRAFNGDWYDVCQIYREWALKQYWCQKGPLAVRTDIPKWYLDSPAVCRFTHTYPVYPEERLQENFVKTIELLGSPLSVTYYSWQKFNPYKSAMVDSFIWPVAGAHSGSFSEPCEGFRKTVDVVHKAGGYIDIYLNSLLYDPGNDGSTEAKQWGTQDITGERTIYDPTEPCWDMCRATTWWQEKYSSICAWLVKEYNIDGIYMDSFGANQNDCFDTSHGHPHGGGNFNVMGQRELAKMVRSLLTDIKPETILTIEHPGETYIDIVTSSLIYPVVAKNFTPLFQTVYHDYFMTVGVHFDYIQCEETPVNFAMDIGSLFVTGSKIGRFSPYIKDYYMLNPRYKKQAEYSKLLVDYRKNLVEYFALGRALRPIKFIPELPRVTSDKPESNPVTMPAVFSGVYQEPAGKVGMVFLNVSDNDVKIDFNYNLSPYIKTDKCTVFNVDRHGERNKIGSIQTNSFKYTYTVKAQQVLFLEFSKN